MPIVKDNRLAARKYYAITDLVIFAVFIIANVFVLMGVMKIGFLVGYDAKFIEAERGIFNFAKGFPGLLYIYNSICVPGFYIFNDCAHDILVVIKSFLEFIQANYASKEEVKIYANMIKNIDSAAKVSNNFVLHFGRSTTEIYAVGEIIIAMTALIYGWIARQVISLFAFAFD